VIVEEEEDEEGSESRYHPPVKVSAISWCTGVAMVAAALDEPSSSADGAPRIQPTTHRSSSTASDSAGRRTLEDRARCAD
jgi:hypothetical protein